MARHITLLAGEKAIETIRNEGVTKKNIRVIAGAAGGPKWLILSGIDRWLFGTFFRGRKDPLYLIGSSIGAWRFAAALRKKPVDAIERFERAYIDQHYDGNPSPAEVTAESFRVMDSYLDEKGIDEVLSNPVMRLSIVSVRAKGLSASENKILLGAGLITALALNAVSRKTLRISFERTVFSDPRDVPPFADASEFRTQKVALDRTNLRAAVMASGSIPLVMQGMTAIPGARGGIYRDGGMIDYHFDMPFVPDGEGLVLYPHFIPRVIPGWLDKYFGGRTAAKRTLDNMVLVCPSEKFLERLPYGKIPDRQDFHTFQGDDKERVKFWNKAVDMNRLMADELANLIESGRVKREVRPFN